MSGPEMRIDKARDLARDASAAAAAYASECSKLREQRDGLRKALTDCLREIDDEIEQRKFSGNAEDWAAIQKVSDAGHAALAAATHASAPPSP